MFRYNDAFIPDNIIIFFKIKLYNRYLLYIYCWCSTFMVKRFFYCDTNSINYFHGEKNN